MPVCRLQVRMSWVLVFLGLLTGGMAGPPAQAQGSDSTAASLVASMNEGQAAFKSGQYREAADVLRAVFAARPSFRASSPEGSAAYWLGRTYEAMGEAQAAGRVWTAGVQAALTRKERAVDTRAADAYVRRAFRDERTDWYEQAARLYLTLLEYGDARPDAARRAPIEAYVDQMAFLLPPEVRKRALDATNESTFDLDASEDGGHQLAAWWRSQDPLPATRKNERVIEHLRRVAHARTQYPRERAPAGFDARGRVYVRLGAPAKKRAIDYYSAEMLNTVRRIKRAIGNNLQVEPSDFRDGTLWLYARGKEPHYYFFVDQGHGYEQGGIADLIPPRLRNIDGDTGRGAAKADIVLEALRTTYRQLVGYHQDFNARYMAVGDYLARMEEARTTYRMKNGGSLYSEDKRSDNTMLMQQNGMPRSSARRPRQFVQSALQQARREDAVNAHRRQERAPRQSTNVRDDADTLPVVARVARFLTEEGTTRTEVYWGVRRASRSDERGALSVTLDRMTPSYRLKRRHRERYQVPDGPQGNIFLVPAPLVATADTTLYHLRAQWDHPPRSTAIHAGQKRRSAVVKWDSLAALKNDSGTLEMSDPLPLLLSDESEIVQARSDTARPGRPYPLDRVQRGMPVALYFEVYHLGIGSNDRTRYTVEYEVYRETERGGPTRLFKGDQEQRTATEATYESRDRTAREYVLLDLKKVPSGRGGEVTVTVRVTDEVTGQQVERAVGFAVVE